MKWDTPMFPRVMAVVVITCSLCGGARAEEQRMRVAEWGTFTVLQNENGEPLPGVNVNEEGLPSFVHRLGRFLIPDVHQISAFSGLRSKGIPSGYPYAIMRMETPIIYFYPPKSRTGPIEVDVSVGFRGGWISEWYPRADVEAPGFNNSFNDMGAISPEKTGKIQWKNLRVGVNADLPPTEEHVWLAPRKVDSAKVATADGESEQYLFYRGVANIDAPLRVVRNRKDSSEKHSLSIETNGWLLQPTDKCTFSAMWLADIRADGKIAFRELSPLTVRGQSERQQVAVTSGGFSKMEYSLDNLKQLRTSMHAALLQDGLTSQESDAMLETWKLSYFQSPGLRLFFSLPRSWTDAILPLSVSTPADITRVMIGRIELVTPEQRKLLNKISKGPVSTSKWFTDAIQKIPAAERERAWQQLAREETTFEELGFEVPDDYQAYLDLGRFRDAIVLDGQRRKGNEMLKTFTKNYSLNRFAAARPASSTAAKKGATTGGE